MASTGQSGRRPDRGRPRRPQKKCHWYVDTAFRRLAYSRSMRFLLILFAFAAALAGTGSTIAAQDLSFREMRWRDIGPTRAGRARALAGVPSQPNTFYAGFDNGGVWRSTDYGANWVPIFDDQSTGSIGAIAVAPSNPNVIYVGTGAASSVPISPSATACTNRPTPDARGSISACATAR